MHWMITKVCQETFISRKGHSFFVSSLEYSEQSFITYYNRRYRQYQMDVYISLGNSKNDLKAIADPAKKAFVQHLVKLFNPKLSAHSKMLRESSGDLARFDSQSTQKQSFLTQTILRFHYVQKSAFIFDKETYSKKIAQDSFDALSKYVQFNFAGKIAAEISQKTMQFFKLTEPAVQQADQKHLVLGTAGALLEVGYKIVYVQLDEGTKWKYWASFSQEPLNKRDKKNQIHFVAILFSVSIVYNPPSKEQDVLITNSQLTFTKKQLDFIEAKRKLMKFVDAKRSNDLYLAFDKFQLLQLGNFKEYWKKYLTKQAIKAGYFDSMKQYISGPNSIFAIGVGQSINYSSRPLEIYNHIVLPAIQILTPINAPMLPDFLSQIAIKTTQGQKMLLRQAQGFKQVTIRNEFLRQSHEKFRSRQKLAVPIQERVGLLQQNFRLQVPMQGKDASYQLQGVKVQQLIKAVQSRVGQIQVNKSQEGNLSMTQYYTGILYDEYTVISNFSIQSVSRARFYLQDKFYQIDIQDDRTTGRILKINSKVEIEAKQYCFSLNFMQDYPSQFCLHEQLVNKNLFMAGIRSDSKGNTALNVQLQVSKVLSLYRREFFELFQKKLGFQGAPIFFVDEARKQCKIIAACENQNNFGSLFRRSQDIKEKTAKKAKNLLDFSTKFLKKEVYAQVVPKAKTMIEQTKFQIFDKNKKGEPLREQLLNKSIKGSSPIELIGIFKMVSHEETKYGIALLGMNNYFIASTSSVLFDGSGYVHVKKSHAEDQRDEEDFQGFDLEDNCLYDHLEILNIITIPGNQEYVYLEVKRSEAEQLKTERKINRNSMECLLDSREIGGFFLKLDFRNTSQTNIVHFDLLQITNNFSTVLTQTEKDYPEKQGIMFAYQKGNPKIQYFLGLYSPKSPLGSFPLPDTSQQNRFVQERLVIAMQQSGDVIELHKMEEVVEKQQYQAIGYFKYRSDPLGFGSGVLISQGRNAAPKKVKKILTCAHNFYDIVDGKLVDDSRNLNNITFCYYKRSLFKFCQLSLKKIIIHPTYKDIIDRRIKEPDSKDPLLDLSPAYDIAIIQIKESVCLQNPFHLELPFALSKQLAAELQTFKKNQILTESFIAQVEVAGFPQDQISLGIVHGKMYRQNVESHKGETFFDDPLFYFNVVPLSRSLQEPLVIDHKLSTLPGQSGSPIFIKKTRMVVGVHVGALKDQRILSRQYTFQNIGSFVYYHSVYQFLKREVDRS